jgi:hypothetical protein
MFVIGTIAENDSLEGPTFHDISEFILENDPISVNGTTVESSSFNGLLLLFTTAHIQEKDLTLASMKIAANLLAM